jgi:flagellar biosynthesis/type III secretory pathway protein FliH
LSSLLRANLVALLDSPATLGLGPPRVFGGNRLLRGDQVGLERPISLSVPTSQVGASELSNEELLVEEEEVALDLPPDFAELEEAARLQGYGMGYEQGQADGQAAAEATMAQSIRRLQQLTSGVLENHTAFFRAAERQVVDLALQIAQKVIEREVENMPDLAVTIIRAALEEMDTRTAVRVRVSPDDEELLRRRWAQVVPPGVSPDRIELVVDERVQSGGAIIDTTQGQVDAQLDTKLAQLGNALWTFVMEVSSEAGEETFSA